MQIELSQDVLINEVDNEFVLLNLNTGHYFGLNEVGVDFWKAAEKQSDYDKILAELLEIYDVDETVLKEDIDNLIKEMSEKGLISLVSDRD